MEDQRPIVIHAGREFYFEETEDEHILTSLEKDKFGMYTVLHFTKDKEKSDQSLERMGRKVIRAMMRGDI